MPNEYDNRLITKLTIAMECFEDFHKNYEDQKIRKKYYLALDDVFDFLENANNDDFHEEYAKQWYQIYYDYNKRNINRREIRIEKLRKSFSYHFLKYILQTEENNSMEEIQSKISKYIVNDTMGEYNANVTLYYKNILEPQQYETFEKMVEFIRRELVRFYTNIIYVEKILSFMHEFNEKGAFPLDLSFLNRYLDTAMSEMILVQTKLFSNANTQKQDNFGFDYLKAFIARNSKDKNVNTLLGGKVREKIKKGKEKCKKLENIRNGMLAHYDVKTVQEGINDVVNLEDLKYMFDLSAELLEMLSLYYFERQSIFNLEMIEIHGFKKVFCQNFLIDNCMSTDLDRSLNLLRRNFIDLNNNDARECGT